MANVSDELERLAALRDKGDISPAEFEKQKAKLLAGGSGKSSGGKRNLGIGCGVIVVLLIIFAIIGSNAPTTTQQGTAAATAEKAAPVEVTAIELARAYQANEARAQKDYGDRPLLVTGTVDGVDLDFVDDPKVKLRTENQFLSAQATLVDADKPKASDLSKGQKITLLCEGVSEVISIPMLSGCSIQ